MEWYKIALLVYGLVSVGWLLFGIIGVKSLAEHAWVTGRTTVQLSKGAHDNAQAFWFLLVITGVLWYFVDSEWWAIALAITTANAAGRSINCSLVLKRMIELEN